MATSTSRMHKFSIRNVQIDNKHVCYLIWINRKIDFGGILLSDNKQYQSEEFFTPFHDHIYDTMCCWGSSNKFLIWIWTRVLQLFSLAIIKFVWKTTKFHILYKLVWMMSVKCMEKLCKSTCVVMSHFVEWILNAIWVIKKFFSFSLEKNEIRG